MDETAEPRPYARLVVAWTPMPQFPIAPSDLLLQVAQDLIVKGWQPVWCTAKQSGGFSPLVDCTGDRVPFPVVFPQPTGAHRLALRPPHDIVIIDVDHYDSKRGADTMDAAEAWLGDLPPTYKMTSRGYDNPSGRYIYRKPADLDFTDSSLAQFGHERNGRIVTDIDVLKTGHRFSWAPGDIHHKNGLTVRCFDPEGEPCLIPDATDPSIPELPQRWTDYLRNPPGSYNLSAYTRPGDGPQWWLLQPDASLGSDTELSGFAFNMMLSRVPVETVYEQWIRVAKNEDPAWPWSREDFDRHTRSQAQDKAAREIAREDAEEAVYEGIAGGPEVLQAKSREANEAYEREQKLVQLREERIYQTINEHNLLPAQPLDSDIPQAKAQPFHDYLKELTRGFPEFTREIKQNLIRKLAEEDVAMLLARPFTGFKSIANLPEPPDPETLIVTGKDTPGTRVVARAKVTVLSGHRSSGKTWVTAVWAAQEMRAGNHVIWVDFERQEDELASKLRQAGLQAHMLEAQLHYTAELPPSQVLVSQVSQFTENGAHRCLVVVDAFRTLQNLVVPGSTANDGDAVEQVYIEYLTPVQEAGANVVLLDHMSKTGDKGTFGSERKESAADYVIRVEKIQQFSRITAGFSSLTVTKARGGHIDEDTTAGFLWVPGDGKLSGESIKDYPKMPELRNWAPEGGLTLADTAGQSEKAQREEAVVSVVQGNRLQLGPRPLGERVFEVYPDLFTSAKAATDLAARMRADGKLSKEDGNGGKYDLPGVRVEVQDDPAPQIDPRILGQHPEAHTEE